MLVPDIDTQPSGTDERMPTPGALTSGFSRSDSRGGAGGAEVGDDVRLGAGCDGGDRDRLGGRSR